MKAILEFNVNDPEEENVYRRVLKALALALALSDIRERMRLTYKYDKEPMSQEEFDEILKDRDIDLDNLLN